MTTKRIILLLVIVGVIAFLAGNYFAPLAFRYQESNAALNAVREPGHQLPAPLDAGGRK